jgi:hypothetical protein
MYGHYAQMYEEESDSGDEEHNENEAYQSSGNEQSDNHEESKEL